MNENLNNAHEVGRDLKSVLWKSTYFLKNKKLKKKSEQDEGPRLVQITASCFKVIRILTFARQMRHLLIFDKDEAYFPNFF